MKSIFKPECYKDLLSPNIQESDIIPYHASPPYGERVLVLAPHPDDETLGCGGALSLLVMAGKAVKVLFITSGDKADPLNPMCLKTYQEPHINDYSLMRESEAVRALNILGVRDYEFLRLPDRGLFGNYATMKEHLIKAITVFKPDAVYCPSPFELNPDHRAAASATLQIKMQYDIAIVFYEVVSTFMPNLLVDITSVHKHKKAAVNEYHSQLDLINYIRYNEALNTFRALTLMGAEFVEAYGIILRANCEAS